MIEDKDFIGHIFPQKCGDFLKVLRKSPHKTSKGEYFYICEFNNYHCILEARKYHILKGTVINPQIEQVEFIDKIWPQNCGDSLKIIKKSNIQLKSNNYLWKCIFLRYPYEILCTKDNIKKGAVYNPQIEIEEFVNKIWEQHCGDSLKIIEKIKDKKDFWKCQFQIYPCFVYCYKQSIINGEVNNPLIEQIKFVGNKFLQHCGDFLEVLEKTDIKRNNRYLFKCKFIGYKKILYLEKQRILSGSVYNQENPQIVNLKEKELSDYIISLYNGDIVINDWNKLDGKEIDIYIPSLKIGFEFNGIYWHSQKFKDKNYHLDKLKLANSKGIKLYYIWEDEWDKDKNKIKQFIKDILFQGCSNLFFNEIDKIGLLKKNTNITNPVLINREGFLCYNCGYKIINK